MAIISVEELPTRQGTINKDLELSGQLSYIVTTDEKQTSPMEVCEATNWHIGDELGGAWVNNISAQQNTEDGLGWTVTVDFGKYEPAAPTPLDEPAEISWSFAQFETPVDFDVFGQPIWNSAQDPFLEAIVKDDSRPVLSVTRNAPSFDPYGAYAYRDAVNSDGFLGAPPGTAKVSNISAQRQWDEDIGYYWSINLEVAFNPEGWNKRVLDVGLREISDGRKKPILAQGVPISDPVPLQNGQQLPQGQPPQPLEFQVYNRFPFNSAFGWMLS